MAEAIIFDIDGTLVDSVDLHARAWMEVSSIWPPGALEDAGKWQGWGHTLYGAQAAAKAGIRTIGLLCGGWPAEELTQASSSVSEIPADLLAHYGALRF